jgi:hypothetical protein
MYFGHLGVGLLAKGHRPATPLWLLLVASLGPDWVETGLMAVGVREPALHSHGVPGALVGCAAFALLAGAITRSRRDAGLVAAVFASHIVLDFLTGFKPTWPGGPRIGLRLYNHPLLDFTIEAAVLIIGWLWYRRSLSPIARLHPATWLLLASLLAGQALFDWKFAKPDSP